MAGFDAVFVGSGINSLAGAALLAKDGWRVCVLERNDWLGGAIKTVDGLTAPGFRHEVFSSWHPLWVGSPAYAELKPDLDRLGLEYLNTDLPTATAFPDGSSAHLSTDGAANVAELGDAWQRQFDEFMAARRHRVRRARHRALVDAGPLARPQGLQAVRPARPRRVRRALAALRARLAPRHLPGRARARPARAVGAAHRPRPRPGDVRVHDAGDRLRAPARRDAGAEGRRREPRRRAGDDRARRGRRAAHRGRGRADRRLGGQGDRRPPRRRRDDRRVPRRPRLRHADAALRPAARRGRRAGEHPRRGRSASATAAARCRSTSP